MQSLMWTPANHALHRREGLRFASDVTDAGPVWQAALDSMVL
jgi:hypothetical protein